MTNKPDPTTPPESPQTAAREIFAHGILEFVRHDSPESQDRRVRLALEAINDESAARRLKFPSPGARALRLFLSAAASVVIIGTASLYFSTTEPTAMGLVQASISAAQKAPVRRYEVRASPTPRSLPDDPQATLDVGSDRHFVIRAKTPLGEQIAGGRGESGEWAIRADGSVETSTPRAYWPRWIFLLDESLTGSPDDILVGLERDFEPRLDSTETIDGVRCRHIRATRRPEPRDRDGDPRPPRSDDTASGASKAPGLEENPNPNIRPGTDRDPGPRRGRPDEGAPSGPREGMGPGPGVPPELAPFLEGIGKPAGGPDDGPRPMRRGPGGPGEPRGPEDFGGLDGPGGRENGMRNGPPGAERDGPRPRGPRGGGMPFVPPEFVPRGEARNRLPASIDIWIDSESMLVRRVDVRWDGPRQPPPDRPGLPRHPGPPSRLEFRLVETSQPAEGWFEAEAHQPDATIAEPR
ncbi:MAG: hypothetical protein ACOYN0_03420 [Phycisphaerales bacterium]